MDQSEQDVAGVIAPPPLIYAAGLALGMLLHRFLRINLLPQRWAKFVGGLLIGLSFVPGGSAAVTMLRAKTNLDPFHPTTAIVTSGSFRYSRNPIYLSFVLFYTGIAALANALAPLLLLPLVLVVMRRGVIEREERYLEGKFGVEYTQYKARVRRWL